MLRAVFHQDGQRGREVDWKETLKWTPRKGSIIYSGEWEWIYGPSSKTPKGNAFEWPIQPKYLDLDFPFATDEEIANLALTKVICIPVCMYIYIYRRLLTQRLYVYLYVCIYI